jgi:HTH-type transcriptional regulator / antitoxin HigA
MNLEGDDELLNELKRYIYEPIDSIPKENLKELFEQRMRDLNVSPTNVLDILKIQYRTLNGILNGTQKTVDLTNLIKIANFLQRPKEQIIKLYLDVLETNFPNETFSSPGNFEFIKENFDLTVLKKANFINNIYEYSEIENRINSFLGLKSISEYTKPLADVAFSAGLIKPKNELTRSFWIKVANDTLKEIDNPYRYDRQTLVEYFPNIRWHSTNVELGFINIIKELYKLGITIIYQSPLPSLHLRGATFSVNGKPCIVLTDYKGFYPTLWFALIHELFHVIFDWDEIQSNNYHLTDEENEQMTIAERETEANDFARDYLFSKKKTEEIRPHLYNSEYVNEYAKNNHVHPSFIYVFNAYDIGHKDRNAWGRARNHNPNIDHIIKKIENPWNDAMPISDFVRTLRPKFYN